MTTTFQVTKERITWIDKKVYSTISFSCGVRVGPYEYDTAIRKWRPVRR